MNPLAFNVREHSSIISLSLLCSNFTHRLGVSAAGVLLYTGLPVSVAEPLRVSMKAMQCTPFCSFAALRVQSNVCPSQLNYLCDNPRIFHKA